MIFKRSAYCFFLHPRYYEYARRVLSYPIEDIWSKSLLLCFLFLTSWFSQMWWLLVFCADGFKMKHASGTWTLLWEVKCFCLAAIPPLNVNNWVPRDRPEIWECTWFLCKLKLLFLLYLSLCSFSKENKWQSIFYFWILD